MGAGDVYTGPLNWFYDTLKAEAAAATKALSAAHVATKLEENVHDLGSAVAFPVTVRVPMRYSTGKHAAAVVFLAPASDGSTLFELTMAPAGKVDYFDATGHHLTSEGLTAATWYTFEITITAAGVVTVRRDDADDVSFTGTADVSGGGTLTRLGVLVTAASAYGATSDTTESDVAEIGPMRINGNTEEDWGFSLGEIVSVSAGAWVAGPDQTVGHGAMTVIAASPPGGSGALWYMDAANVLLGVQPNTPLKNRIPCIHVHLGEDWSAEDWSAMLRTHGGDMIIALDLAMHQIRYVATDPESVYVYGKSNTGKRGIVTFTSDVINALQNATSGHRAGGSALSVRYIWRTNRLVDGGLHGVTIAALVTVQFSSGLR